MDAGLSQAGDEMGIYECSSKVCVFVQIWSLRWSLGLYEASRHVVERYAVYSYVVQYGLLRNSHSYREELSYCKAASACDVAGQRPKL